MTALYPCKNWNIFNSLCNRFDNNLEQIGTLSAVRLSEKDFDNTCKGKSNINLCCWFVYSHSTIMDFERRIKREGKR